MKPNILTVCIVTLTLAAAVSARPVKMHAESGISGPEITLTDKEIKDDFYISGISDELFERIRGKSYKDDCPVPPDDLRYLHVLHVDAEGNTLEGELICNREIAEDLLEIFRELYEAQYPIEKIRLVDEYDADDETSMTADNTSSFNYRKISHSSRISKHGLGLAIDINPLYNPSTKSVNGEWICEPPDAWAYLDRNADFPYKIVEGDLLHTLFKEHGYRWGGDWVRQKDYQHFEVPDDKVRELYPGMGY